jgi:hypothetical protein
MTSRSLTAWTISYRGRYPAVQIEIEILPSDEIVRALERETIQVGFLRRPDEIGGLRMMATFSIWLNSLLELHLKVLGTRDRQYEGRPHMTVIKEPSPSWAGADPQNGRFQSACLGRS